jgi:aspartate aminotransferase
MLQPHIQEAGIVALCSPLNPTGTVFTEPALSEICDLIVAENERRKGIRKPLYLIYDQIYWQLCFGDTKHIDPVSINPAMRPYTIFIDGISKAYGATGVRVGWAFGPRHVIDKMKSILGHVGAWAPKPEQVGTSIFMSDEKVSGEFLKGFKSSIHERLDAFYKGFIEMKQAGLPVDAIAPKAAIYLTVKIDLTNRSTPEGTLIHSVEETTRYILDKAGLALVPFSAFGADKDSTWYRLSVGTVKTNDIPVVLDQLRKVIEPLN